MSTTSLSHFSSQPVQERADVWDVVEVSPLVDFTDIWSIVRRRMFLLVAIPVLCVVLAIVYLVFFATPLYRSSALLFVDPKFESILQIEDIQSVASDLDSLNSLERAITSDSMILRVIDHLGLRNDLDFLPKPLRENAMKGKVVSDSELVSVLRAERISAALIRPTRLLELSVFDTDPVRAKTIAETFVSEFETFLGEKKKEEAGNSEKGLRHQAEEAYNRALEAEKKLEAFRLENPEFTVEQDHQLFAERLSKVGEELNLASGRVFDLKSINETLNGIDPQVDPVKVIETGRFSGLKQVSDILEQRTAARTNLAAVDLKYTKSHPLHMQAVAQVEESESQLRQLASDLKESVATSLEAAERNEKMLTDRVRELQATLVSVKAASAQFNAIQQKVETEWMVHDRLQAQIGQTSTATEKSTSITTVMSAPLVPHKPDRPNKPLSVLIAGFLGCCLSVCLVGTEMLRGRPFVNRRQVENNLRIRTVARIPEVDETGKNDEQLMRELSNVYFSPEHRASRIIHVASVSEATDGLHISACLAAVSASHGCPTLLISVLDGEEPGSLISFEPKHSRTNNLDTLTLAANFLVVPNGAVQLLGPNFREYGRIVIESTAVSKDDQVPAVLASLSDSNLLVLSMDRDNRREARDTVAHLSRHAQSSLSLVLQG